MRVVLQRVSKASVEIGGINKADINTGLLIFLGIEHDDDRSDVEWLCNKVNTMRIFSDNEGKMNLSVSEADGGAFLVVSQFTLHASTKKGNRPSFIKAAKPEIAIPLYQYFILRLREISGLSVKSGEFGADMKVSLLNDGPVTIIIDSKNRE
jgi:D-aminoacyl-tRNA deacylase